MSEMTPQAKALYDERLKLVSDAIALKPVSRVPIYTLIAALPFHLYNATWADQMYDFEAAGQAYVKFYEEFHPDVFNTPGFSSGKANELSGANMLDWPGRPGTKVPVMSSYQTIEQEYLQPEEYPEFLRDYTGFLLRKYIPRAYPNLNGGTNISLVTSRVVGSEMLAPLGNPAFVEAVNKLSEIHQEVMKAPAAAGKFAQIIKNMGYPQHRTVGGEAPYDILGDYYRGTLGIMEDILEIPDYVEAACYMLADLEIERYTNIFKGKEMDVRRVFIPMHKGMDGFMSPAQYERFYWKPFKKVIDALVAMDVTPYLYTEGKYDTRLEQLTEVPVGKCIIHFENVDMARAARMFEGIACICGNMPITLLGYGKPEEVVDSVKWLIDTCAPHNNYMFDANGSLEEGKRECVEAMFDTLYTYGKR
ncbi:MAG: hypothetical protein E7224_00020 [Clostridiales bacterium]|nr:hypothetical protein [Clostridiales bacterium]